ncbi:MAG TPA: Y-family DNA polymerase [Treponemataceae bacterium]|nr:Y-family DNA polymerase [Treponemataceae bacterium]
MIFHIDANSFYASCERIFRPDLAEKPIVVLSNNDGIVIALNDEAKTEGLKRGDAWFKVAPLCREKNISVFSSNYTLYADMSSRIVSIYNRLCPDVEVYSIDECFLYFPDWKCPDFAGLGWHIRNMVLRETGMPVSVGIAPTRTLAKMCNKLAKKRGGVFFWEEVNKDATLAAYPAGDIWGIGRSKTTVLKRYGIHTALDLKNFPLEKAKKHLSITGLRTVQELQGIPAIESPTYDKRQNICSSKSFGEPVCTLEALEEALTSYTTEAVSRMRSQQSRVRYIAVFLMTNPWNEEDQQYTNHLSVELSEPTSNLTDIAGTALSLLRKMYRSGYRYRKVMVNLLGLEDDSLGQGELFSSPEDTEKNRALMNCLDSINDRYGRGSVRLALNTQKASTWAMQRRFLSPAYTTDISAIPTVH